MPTIPAAPHHEIPLITPQWPAPNNVHAVVSTRAGGVSAAPWQSLNLGLHVQDRAEAVQENRARLLAQLQKISPCQPQAQWLNQVHGTAVIEVKKHTDVSLAPNADAVTTRLRGVPIVVMTADCLPVFFCDKNGEQIAVAHAGWRGLCDGVLEKTLSFFAQPADVLAWLGPAIGPQKFEVGADVRAAFLEKNTAHAEEVLRCFLPSENAGKFLANIYSLATLRLKNAGVQHISGGDFCTVSDVNRFFSYRRDGQTGRMASVIWLA